MNFAYKNLIASVVFFLFLVWAISHPWKYAHPSHGSWELSTLYCSAEACEIVEVLSSSHLTFETQARPGVTVIGPI